MEKETGQGQKPLIIKHGPKITKEYSAKKMEELIPVISVWSIKVIIDFLIVYCFIRISK